MIHFKGRSSPVDKDCGLKALGIGFESFYRHFFLLLKRISFVRTDGQTDRQTDKHPQSCSENMPFGKPLKGCFPAKILANRDHFEKIGYNPNT